MFITDFADIATKIQFIGDKYHLKLMLLYGSQATGKARADSDIDIAVLGHEPIEFESLLDLRGDLARLFETENIDVKSLHHTDPLFRYEATRHSRLLYGKEYDYHSFKNYAFRAYQDSWDLRKLKEKLIEKRLASLQKAEK
jgi:predicted nucleotidyltransferase